MNNLTMEFQVESQILSRTDTQRIVEDSINYLYAHFTFSEDWANTTKAIIVENKNVDLKYKVYLDNTDTCKIPSNIVDYDGFNIIVVGENESDYVTITTSLLFVAVLKSNFVQAEESYVKYILSQTLNAYKNGDTYTIEIPNIYATSLGTNGINTVVIKNRNNEELDSVELEFINDSESNSNQTYSSNKIESELSDRDSAIQRNANNIQTNLNRLIQDEARITQNELDIVGLKNTDTTHDGQIRQLRLDLTDEIAARQNADTTLNNSILAKLNRLDFSMDSNYRITLKGYDSNNNLLYSETIDLPSESAIVDIEFDSATNELIFTLQNGNQTRVPLGSIITGLATTDYVDGLNAQRIARENQIEGALNDEITNRQNADTALGGRIDSANNEIALRIKYSDIIDVLTSTDSNKPLSANQGKVLKGLIDTLNDAETGIQANEAVRIQNENTRIANENARVLAEQNRATEFAGWESTINGKQNALTAGTGITLSTTTLTNDTIAVDTDVIATKTYAESLFATDQEIADMLEEVLG